MEFQKELEDAGLTDFRVFLYEVWTYLNLPDPTPVQLDIGKRLQQGERRQIIQAFRGVGKSWITVAFVLWCLLLNPDLKIMVVSASQDLADDFSKFCKQLIHGMPLLQHLAPKAGQRDSGIKFDVGPASESKDPSVKSVGITGQLTGSRADLIVADDIEIPKNSYTHVMRERLAELVKEFDAVLKPNGRVVYLGTPQIEASLYTRLWKDRGYSIRIWPAEVPSKPEVYGTRLAPFVQKMLNADVPAGTPIDPIRFSREDLLERKASYGHAGYSLQFMLDTSPSDAERHPLKLHDLIVHDCDAELAPVRLVWGGSSDLAINDLQAGGLDGDVYHRPAWISTEMAPYTETVMAIDPSGMGKDETGFAIVKYLHGLLYLVDIGGFVDGFGEATLNALAGKALRWKVNNIVIEENYGGGMFNKLLEPVLIRVGLDAQRKLNLPDRPPAGRIDYEWNGWSSAQKEERILDTLVPVVQNHKLIVSRALIEQDIKQQHESSKYSFIQQYTRMARIKKALPHEDRLEALSMCAAYLTEKMNRDQKQAHDAHRESLKDKELANFIQHVFGVRKGAAGDYHRWTH
jgi:hypothetical protein